MNKKIIQYQTPQVLTIKNGVTENNPQRQKKKRHTTRTNTNTRTESKC